MMHNLVSNMVHFLLLLTTSLMFFQIPCRADGEVMVLQTCFNSANYTSGSQFETNLNHLFTLLYANAPLNGFNATVTGQDPDQVYGLVQCKGDSSPEDCRKCINTSSIEIVRLCPNRQQGAIRYGHCLLRYSDKLFFNQPENNLRIYAYGAKDVLDPVQFDHQLGALMNNLSYSAAHSQSKFATGMVSFMDFQHIYGLLQCTRDLSESNCESCLQYIVGDLPNCCNTKPGGNIFAVSCVLRFEMYPFYKILPSPPNVIATPPTLPSPIEVSTTNSTRRDGNENNLRIVVITAIPLLTAMILISYIFTCLLWRKSMKKNDVGDITGEDSFLMDLSTIKIATRNFSDANKLGEGGFGPVYKGTLFDGCEIAVKRLLRSSMHGLEQLKTEVDLVAKLQHRNLVRLLGCCLEEQEKLLVYEYLPNSSLDRFLFDPVNRPRLNWKHRYKIITGIARGLLYLHQDSQLMVIHRDLKASNILLDENMNPKISDFGLAKLFGGSQTGDTTSRIAGTYGYMAPEYAIQGHFSTKSDVFSFGVLVLEIVTGQKSTSFDNSNSSTNLISYVWQHWNGGSFLELLDPTLGEQCPRSEVLRCIHIGLLCVEESAKNRPTTSSVVLMLDSNSVTLPRPSEPAFLFRFHKSNSDNRKESINDVTITELDPR